MHIATETLTAADHLNAELLFDAAIGRLVRNFGKLDSAMHDAIKNIVEYGLKGSYLNRKDLDLFTEEDKKIQGALKRRFAQFRKAVCAIDAEELFISNVDYARTIFDDLLIARNCICHNSSSIEESSKYIELRRPITTHHEIFNYETTNNFYFYLTIDEVDAIAKTISDIYWVVRKTEIDVMYKYSRDDLWAASMLDGKIDLRSTAWLELQLAPSPWDPESSRGTRPRSK
ncbi:hypothetical protein [Ensifer sp.]|jgi:hypothetical protein|uniref:hypothetical protein n=1 Tax=Ensifer sp. TaxID=1872086 RepID=UPI002E139DE8|nr:hypothetical protein [Ensifer sp.]